MRKTIMVILFTFMSIYISEAQGTVSPIILNNSYSPLLMLDSNQDSLNLSVIDLLSRSEARQIEMDKRNDRLLGFLLNFLIPGLGSLIIGDTTGGVTAMVGYFGSCVVAYSGIYIVSYIDTASAALMTVGGGIGMLGFGIFNLVIPFTYVEKKNYSYSDAE